MRKELLGGAGLVLGTILILGLAALRRESPAKSGLAHPVLSMSTPAPPGSRLPNVVQEFGGDQLALSWVEAAPGNSQSMLRFAVLRAGVWSLAKLVVMSTKFNPHPSVLPEVAILGDGSVVADWTQLMNADPKNFSEDVYAAASRDGGATWTVPVRVNRDNTASEHSLVSTAAGEKRANLIWLDGRDSARSGEYALVHASVDGLGKVGPETILDSRVCTCCPTAITRTSSGMAVAYRDRTQDEIRDISVMRFEHESWQAPAVVHQDGWRINAAPTMDQRSRPARAPW
jgi:hypothetical protein